jgi:hypothetical protein
MYDLLKHRFFPNNNKAKNVTYHYIIDYDSCFAESVNKDPCELKNNDKFIKYLEDKVKNLNGPIMIRNGSWRQNEVLDLLLALQNENGFCIKALKCLTKNLKTFNSDLKFTPFDTIEFYCELTGENINERDPILCALDNDETKVNILMANLYNCVYQDNEDENDVCMELYDDSREILFFNAFLFSKCPHLIPKGTNLSFYWQSPVEACKTPKLIETVTGKGEKIDSDVAQLIVQKSYELFKLEAVSYLLKSEKPILLQNLKVYNKSHYKFDDLANFSDSEIKDLDKLKGYLQSIVNYFNTPTTHTSLDSGRFTLHIHVMQYFFLRLCDVAIEHRGNQLTSDDVIKLYELVDGVFKCPKIKGQDLEKYFSSVEQFICSKSCGETFHTNLIEKIDNILLPNESSDDLIYTESTNKKLFDYLESVKSNSNDLKLVNPHLKITPEEYLQDILAYSDIEEISTNDLRYLVRLLEISDHIPKNYFDSIKRYQVKSKESAHQILPDNFDFNQAIKSESRSYMCC